MACSVSTRWVSTAFSFGSAHAEELLLDWSEELLLDWSAAGGGADGSGGGATGPTILFTAAISGIFFTGADPGMSGFAGADPGTRGTSASTNSMSIGRAGACGTAPCAAVPHPYGQPS